MRSTSCPAFPPTRLVVIHFHYEPGGVRRVIERSLPSLAAAGGLREIVLAGGAQAPHAWLASLREACSPCVLSEAVCPELAYVATLGRPPSIPSLRRFLRLLLPPSGQSTIWAHNLGVAKNPALANELLAAAAASGTKVVSHHHDFWCDNRWQRLADAALCDLGDPDSLAHAIFPSHPNFVHAAINRRDFLLLRKFFGNRAAWLPNGIDPPPPPSHADIRAAREWLTQHNHLPHHSTIWLLPSRFLRRKNILEAILIAKKIAPKAWVLTTGKASSSPDAACENIVRQSSPAIAPQLLLDALSHRGVAPPPMHLLLAAADAVVQPSIQEGFGLAFLEAAASGRPLIARSLQNISPDLARAGFLFPDSYPAAKIPREAIDLALESDRQTELLRRLFKKIPPAWLPPAHSPTLSPLPRVGNLDFGRLTLEGQIEALRSGALPSNLPSSLSGLPATPPANSTDFFSLPRYARRFWQAAAQASSPQTPADPAAFQRALAARSLSPENFYPLLQFGEPS